MQNRRVTTRRPPRTAGAAFAVRALSPVGLGVIVALLAAALVATLLTLAGRDGSPAAAVATPAQRDDLDAIVTEVIASDPETASAQLALMQAAVDGSATAATTASLADALATYREDRAAIAYAVLNDDADAAADTEDALYAAVQTMLSADADELAAAVIDVAAAEDAVRASAEQYRAHLIADTAATFTQPTGTSVTAQLAALLPYAYDYNDETWGNYNDYGGDCVNFTSQGLLARGWVMDDTWYSGGEMWTASDAWISTPSMAAYLDSLGLPYSTQDDLDRVRVGDIGIFSWADGAGDDHTMTVSRIEYTPDGPRVYFVSHNADGTARELSTTLTEQHPGSTVKIYHIP